MLIFLAGYSDSLSELTFVFVQYNNSFHNSFKMTPFQGSKKSHEKEVYSNFKDNREVRKPKFELGQFVRTADIKRVFGKGDSTNHTYKLYTKTEVIYNTKLTYRIDYLPDRYNQNLLLPTKLTLEQNSQVTKEVN